MTFLWVPISPPTHMTKKLQELPDILQGLNFYLKKLNRSHDRKCEIRATFEFGTPLKNRPNSIFQKTVFTIGIYSIWASKSTINRNLTRKCPNPQSYSVIAQSSLSSAIKKLEMRFRPLGGAKTKF